MGVPVGATVFFALVLLAQAASSDFTVSSSAFSDQGFIPHVYSYSGSGCTGRNMSPPLSWAAGPPGTRSYALTVFDPDARAGAGWWHWIVFNIPLQTTRLVENAGLGTGENLPKGSIQGRNDFESVGWGGPCPPPGPPHHYVFTVYALDVDRLYGTSELTGGPVFLKTIKGHVLAQAKLVGRFSR
jgi:Raf kinase inhibitor-like YbhB/YbcL family protein